MQNRLSHQNKLIACSMYEAGDSSSKIASLFGVSSVAIRGILKRRGIKIRSDRDAQIKCSLNEGAFDEINSESAYWAGFLFADGCIFTKRSGSPSLTLRLSAKDETHVNKFQKFVGSSHKILVIKPAKYSPNESIQLQFRSLKITSRLQAIGMDGLNSNPSKELLSSRDFWRGVIDGDGCIGLTKRIMNSKNRIDSRLELVGGEILLQCFIDFLKDNFENIKNTVRPHKSIFKVGLMGSTADNVIDFLYSNSSTYLDRKYDAAKNILNRLSFPVGHDRLAVGETAN